MRCYYGDVGVALVRHAPVEARYRARCQRCGWAGQATDAKAAGLDGRAHAAASRP
jgi:hypothetical protein